MSGVVRIGAMTMPCCVECMVARDIGVLTTRQAERFLSTIGSVRRMLGALIRRLPSDPIKASTPPGAKESA
jgi:hypothetical protein